MKKLFTLGIAMLCSFCFTANATSKETRATDELLEYSLNEVTKDLTLNAFVVDCDGKITGFSFDDDDGDPLPGFANINDGDIIQICDLPSEIKIRAGASGPVESVHFSVSGAVAINLTDNSFPYRTFNEFDVVPGTYTVNASAFSENNAQGDLCDSETISFTVVSCGSSCNGQITGFSFDDDDGDPLPGFANINDGDIIQICDLPSEIKIRAGASGSVESVHFSVSGAVAINLTDNSFPYRTFNEFDVVPGTYTVNASAFSENNAQGDLCDSETISFTVVSCGSSCNGQITGFSFDDDDGDPLPGFANINDGDIIQICDLPSEIKIRAGASGSVESVHFSVSGAVAINLTDNSFPYRTFNEFDVVPGTYTVNASAFSENNAQGDLCDSETISFTVVSCGSSCNGQITGFSFDDDDGDPLPGFANINDGDIIQICDLPSEIKIRAGASGSVESVHFSVSGAVAINLTDNSFPYRTFNEFDVVPGTYTVNASAFSENNAQGDLCDSETISFTVVSCGSSCDGTITKFQLNDTNGNPLPNFGEINNGATIQICDLPATIRIEAVTTGTVESVQMDLLGPVNESRIENIVPFETGSFTVQTGTYVLNAQAFSENGASGDFCDEETISFTVISCGGGSCNGQITGFTAVDLSGGGAPEFSISDGDVLSICEIPSSIRVIAATAGSVESVAFTVSGAESSTKTDNSPPYRTSTIDIVAGTYIINAQAFSQDGASGELCDEETISFTVISCGNGSCNGRITAFSIADDSGGAGDTPDFAVANGDVFLTCEFPTDIRVFAATVGTVESVEFTVSGAANDLKIDNDALYRTNSIAVVPGTYTVNAIAFSQDDAAGELCDEQTITFTVLDCNLPCDGQITGFSIADVSGGGAPNFSVADGDVLLACEIPTDIRVVAEISGTVGSVEFTISGADSQTKVDDSPPYRSNTIEVAPGTYTVVVKAFSEDGTTGELCDEQTITFTVTDCNLPCDGQITGFSIADVSGGGAPDFAVADGDVLLACDIPTDIRVVATASGTVGSVGFTVSGADSQTKVDDSPPYRSNTLEVVPGTYTVVAKAFSQDGAAGELCDEQTITFTVTDCNLPCDGQITGFSITDVSGGGAPDFAVADGDVLLACDIPTDIRVVATASGTVGSVGFTVSGADSQTKVDDSPPYRSNTLEVVPGTYTVVAKAFSQDGAAGELCDEQTITFTVTDCNLPCDGQITGFSITDVSGGGAPDFAVADGDVLLACDIPTDIRVIATTSGTVGSVGFTVSGADSQTKVDDSPPYRTNTIEVVPGTYTVLAKAFKEDGATGELCDEVTITFIVEDCPGPLALVAPEIFFFDAYMVERRVRLNWAANNGYMIDYFIIERSSDGLNFSSIGKVDNFDHFGSEALIYTELDEDPMFGVNYYRIKRVLKSGNSGYSSIQKVEFGIDLKEVALYPNPASHESFLHLKNFAGKPGHIRIYDLVGQIMEERVYDEIPSYPMRFDLSGYKSGLYNVTIKIDMAKQITRKLIVTTL